VLWRKHSNSWKCSYFQNVSWYKINVHLFPTTCKWCAKRSLFILENWWHWTLMHCRLIFYKFTSARERPLCGHYAPSIHISAEPALVQARNRFLPDSQSGITSRKCGLRGRPRGFLVCHLGQGQKRFGVHTLLNSLFIFSHMAN